MDQVALESNLRSRRFKLLSNEYRLRLLEILSASEKNVNTLCAELNIEQSLLSHHLALLRKEDMLVSYRKGKEVYYGISPSIKIKGETHKFDLGCCKVYL